MSKRVALVTTTWDQPLDVNSPKPADVPDSISVDALKRLETFFGSGRAWGNRDEVNFVIRTIAAAAGTEADVRVVLLDGGPINLDDRGGTWKDGAFTVTRLEADRPRPLSEAMLCELVGATPRYFGLGHGFGWRPAPPFPPVVLELLSDFGGGDSLQLCEFLDEYNPDVVLAVGYRQKGVRNNLEYYSRSSASRRLVLMPLSWEDPLQSLPIYDDIFHSASSIITVNQLEHEAVYRRFMPWETPLIHNVGMTLEVDENALDSYPAGLEEPGYILVLAEYPVNFLDPRGYILADYLRLQFPNRFVAIAEGDKIAVYKGRKLHTSIERATRMDLWRVMAHALCTVDLRPSSVFGREVIESMLYATPVVAREGSIGQHYVESANGGLWFASVKQLTACLSELADHRDLALVLGRQARSWAERHYLDAERFVPKVAAGLWQQ
ncbi:MAG: hypothetical protein M1483_06910 [Actinobacteria bacterium]|nr:hypothetical protein [Actinomycetota bacterium]MCL6105338.1 hypothetical protein [Actinomycetota bacterium]